MARFKAPVAVCELFCYAMETHVTMFKPLPV